MRVVTIALGDEQVKTDGMNVVPVIGCGRAKHVRTD